MKPINFFVKPDFTIDEPISQVLNYKAFAAKMIFNFFARHISFACKLITLR
jgi:hypothetical protein